MKGREAELVILKTRTITIPASVSKTRHGRQIAISDNLAAWITVTTAAKWQSIADVRRVFPQADLATVGSSKTVTIFNIAGSHHRLIAAIHHNTRGIFIPEILNHADYSKDRWKNDL
ncbi:MAG: type II toxin-antitoxin system HigB family toxin [Akkermansiaceae bacterium]